MKKENSENEQDDSYDSILYEEESEFKLYKGIMNQKISKKNIILPREISKKQKIINKLFRDRFGKNFIPIKLESLKAFESFIKFFLFSPQSKILSRFPKLRKQILKERDIDYNALNDKINVGSLLYLNLSGSGTTLNKNINEKFFQISKNMSTTIAKDNISNQVYNVKYLSKNAERINKILSYKNKDINDLNHERRYLKTHTDIIRDIKIQDNIYRRRNKNDTNLNMISNKTYDNFYKNTFNNININNKRKSLNYQIDEDLDENKFPSLYKPNEPLKKNKNLKLHKKIINSVTKLKSRNIQSNFARLDGICNNTNGSYENNDFSKKTFSPFSTFTNFNKQKNHKFFKQTKIYQNDIQKFVQNLNNQTSDCNEKLIKLINGNRKVKIKTIEEKKLDLINLKNILMGNKKPKKKKKINNIKQIKLLIKKAKLDIEGEANLEKIKKKELKGLGRYLNNMTNENALFKINELYTKEQLKKHDRNFAQEELERLRKKRIREIKVFHARKKAKSNYLKMVQMKNDLILIKDKFDKIDADTTRRTNEIKKNNRNISNKV